jgi:hypothetical protein
MNTRAQSIRAIVAVMAFALVAGPLGIGVADAQNPHLVSADPALSDPIFSSGHLAWDASLNVPFKIAGLGNNKRITVTLTTKLNFYGSVGSKTSGATNSIDAKFGISNEIDFFLSAFSTGGTASIRIEWFETSATLTSDQNGYVDGILTFPGYVNGSLPDNLACVQVLWEQNTLTFGGQTVSLLDVAHRFEPPRYSCNNQPFGIPPPPPI